jgi:hypothetical protein
MELEVNSIGLAIIVVIAMSAGLGKFFIPLGNSLSDKKPCPANTVKLYKLRNNTIIIIFYF